MASGADLISRVATVSGMNGAAASADRALILSFLQQAVDTIAVEAEINNVSTATAALTTGTTFYNLTTSPFALTGFVAIDNVTITDTALTNVPLEQITMIELRTRYQGALQANASSFVYAVEYPTIAFYPAPIASTTLNVSYVSTSVTLADSGASVTFIPNSFLWGCVAEYATALAMRYKKNSEWQAYLQQFQSNTMNGLPALKRWVSRVGGFQRPGEQSYHQVISSPSQDTWNLG